MAGLTIPRVLAALLAAALGAYVFVYGPTLPISAVPGGHAAHALAPKTKQSALVHSVFPPVGKKFIGIMNGNGGAYNFSTLDSFTKAVGRKPEVYEFSQGWALNQFNRGIVEQVVRRGMLPMITWEPWNYLLAPKAEALRGYQPAYRLSNIIDGRYDSYIRAWAEGVKSLGFTIAIRFAHEMNGFWYPWAVFANGNRIRQYVEAWRHVHNIFTEVGATNVIWVWSPNIIWNNFTDLEKLYPGNSYVNWIGLDGYYGTPGKGAFQDFDSLFDNSIAELRTFTDKPLVITETGATNVDGLMAQWITDMFQELPAHTDIIGLIWYEDFNVIDWKVSDYPAASAAFRQGFASPLYHVVWKPGMIPLSEVPLPASEPVGPVTSPSPPVPTATATASPAPGPGPTGRPSPKPSASRSPSPRPSPSPSPSSPSPTPTQATG
jgi:mannan endo-1,4-beta-mannosidase